MNATAVPDTSALLPVPVPGAPGEAVAVLHQAARAMFGATALVTEVVLRTLADSAPNETDERRTSSLQADDVADGLLGLGWGAARVTVNVAGLAVRAMSVALDPPLVPQKLRPVRLLRHVSLSWRAERAEAVRSLAAWSTIVAPAAGQVAVRLVDVDQLLLTSLERIDLQQLAAAALEELDVDDLMGRTVAELELRPLIEQVLAGIDLTSVMKDVIARVDLEEVAGDALDQVDLTALVLERVDLPRVVASVLDQMDLTELVLERVDVIKVADAVVDGIDLPGLIRGSTGSMASETITGIRLQGVEADRAVSRLVDRVLLRRKEER